MSHRACCHTCYTIQLMHYSQFKIQSLQHLNPIKCLKRVCKYKTPTCFGIFFTNMFRGSSAVLCAENTKHIQMTYTHAATYCVIIQTQRTQISGRNSKGTKHNGGPHEDGREKNTETCRGFIFTNTFLTFYWLLNVIVIVL
jgi:hypothetical protein